MGFSRPLLLSATLTVSLQHCTSNDPLKDPEFDMHYFEDDAGAFKSTFCAFNVSDLGHVDLEVMAEGARFMRKVANTAPLKNLFGELVPICHA